ncbi:MAG: DNA primase [Thermoprotei archaeon]|nr:MAG: DNA primase [Thermoprotei archaeon]
MKYLVYASLEVNGVVEKPDVIGAIFGATEGILGEELDLRGLQKSGRIGRIQVKLESRNGKTIGTLIIPSNLDRVETALIAAAVESVDKIGPYDSKIRVIKIEDQRIKKRKWIIERAKELLRKWDEFAPESKEVMEEVLKAVRVAEVIEYGVEKLPAGPDVDKSDTIIIVEGRADVINLLKHGYRNVIALGGASVPQTIIDLSKRKKTIVFIDGDRGGELILKKIIQMADIDYIAKAPLGREVEELTGKEIAKALQNKIPIEEIKASIQVLLEKPLKKEVKIPENVLKMIEEIQGTLEAFFLDKNWQVVEKVAVKDLAERINNLDTNSNISTIVFDGIVTQRILDVSKNKNIQIIIGARMGNILKKPRDIKIYIFDDLLKK